MSGHHSFAKLTANFSEERKSLIREKTKQLESEIAMQELRQAFKISQADLAAKLNIKQPAISSLEKSSDIYISHLRKVIEAMGGKLEITANFSNTKVKITNFDFSEDN